MESEMELPTTSITKETLNTLLARFCQLNTLEENPKFTSPGYVFGDLAENKGWRILAHCKKKLLAVAKYLLGTADVPEIVSAPPATQYICLRCGTTSRWVKPLAKEKRAPP